MTDLKIKHNELTPEEFIRLWTAVWDGPPSYEQTKLALEHTLFSVSVFDGDKIVAMARGIGRTLIDELMRFIRENGVGGTDIFVELCAMPDKIPFYEKLGFSANEAQRLRLFCRAE